MDFHDVNENYSEERKINQKTEIMVKETQMVTNQSDGINLDSLKSMQSD